MRRAWRWTIGGIVVLAILAGGALQWLGYVSRGGHPDGITLTVSPDPSPPPRAREVPLSREDLQTLLPSLADAIRRAATGEATRVRLSSADYEGLRQSLLVISGNDASEVYFSYEGVALRFDGAIA